MTCSPPRLSTGNPPWGLEYDGWSGTLAKGELFPGWYCLSLALSGPRLCPAAEGCGVGGEIGEPRRLERCPGPRGTGRDWCGTSASVSHPAALRRSWLAEISAGSLFFVPSSRGLLLSHMLLLKLLCYPLLPCLLPPPSSLQCTHLTPLQTHGPIVSAPFLALWLPDEAS